MVNGLCYICNQRMLCHILTMRTILTLKGYRYIAAVVSFLEVLVYVVGLGLVMSSLDQIQNIFAYALGFSVGIIVGMKIEEKLALGYTVVNVTSSEYELDLPNELKILVMELHTMKHLVVMAVEW